MLTKSIEKVQMLGHYTDLPSFIAKDIFQFNFAGFREIVATTMSDEYEVPSPHEHALEEAAEKSSLAQRIALMTAILATIGAVFNHQSESAESRALELKNESILLQAKASDSWAHYQASSTKAHLSEVASLLAQDTDERARFTAEKARYEKEKESLKVEAEGFEKKSEEATRESEQVLRPHRSMSAGMTLIQIAVALASITALTRRRWLFAATACAAVAGIATALSGLL